MGNRIPAVAHQKAQLGLQPPDLGLDRGMLDPALLVQLGRRGQLSGRSYVNMIRSWKAAGYSVKVIFLKLPSVEEAIARVLYRVRSGGHHVPEDVIRRRFSQGWSNFEGLYRPSSTLGWSSIAAPRSQCVSRKDSTHDQMATRAC